MLIIGLFVLQVLSACVCYDIELQGTIKVGKKFLKALRHTSHQFKKSEDNPTNDVYSKYLGEPLKDVAIFRTSNREIKKSRSIIPDPWDQFTNHFTKKGKQTLTDVVKLIIHTLNIQKDASQMLDTATTNYLNGLHNYYEIFKQNQNDPLYDTESVYLDFAETSCRLLYNEEKKILSDIIMHEKYNAGIGKYEVLSDQLLKLNKRGKREAIKYVCDMYSICRDYPAFTDYGPELINELLNLHDTKFASVLLILTNVFKDNYEIFEKISEKEDRELILAEFRGFMDRQKMNSFLVSLRTLITHRFKIFSIGSEEYKVSTKAAKILMEILNKAITADTDLTKVDFDNVVYAIKNWADGKNNNFEILFDLFLRNSLRKLEYNLTGNAKDEIKVLIRTIMRGNTQDNEVFQRLFKFGSTYVTGEDLIAELKSH